jgi:outer membrane lipoprotein-sorting protein
MSSLRAHRSALISLSLCVLVITSCRTASEPSPNEAPATDTVVSSTPPFKTKEPERYSATRTITIFSPNGDPLVSKTLIAKDGPMRREEPLTTEVRTVYLDLPEGRFILYPDDKVYASAVAERAPADPSEGEENSPDLLLHKDPIRTTYQSLGTGTVNGRSTTKYRIVVNNSRPENVSLNETVMWIDDALNMPIKSETKSPAGTRSVMELSDLALDPDKQLFQIPAGYEKIVFSALEKQLKARRLNPSLR